ncbi:glycosyltransferase [Azospirillum sp. RWY-5-1]|uniref:Glycosyltransferase n=1 Tax=Azospirillum oleiclasticum TaxID=2735135 RepID=A0ABX2T4L8_9PROT|nr:glycosyltransferase [Azospirillum oleiclasticum]NYZ12115.1 glycosyltransferase [Azospirillum oleiclasticum]NYZ19275.1 glycosyltransferase [Azospirillum oleiclasticum]
MRIVLFTHSLVSCWNHGNAHFLRGVVRDLRTRGHDVRVLEPRDGWSRQNLRADGGEAAEAAFHDAFPSLTSHAYDPAALDLDRTLDGVDAVIVHEWTDPALVAGIGRVRAGGGRFALLFHDTHHRMVSKPEEMAGLDLSAYDGVLAFGAVLRDRYAAAGWGRRAWTWHEAADTALFHPLPGIDPGGELVWIGNWGDDERTAELHEFLLEPVRRLRLKALIHGVRYPNHALRALAEAGIRYGGWLPNHKAPEVFARHRVTVHVPRRPYVEALPGIPTIRVFEALACGVPLVSAPWEDAEGLFRPGTDFLIADDGAAMERHLRDVLNDRALAADLARYGRETVLARHTCAHRAEELLSILAELGATGTADAFATGETAR